MAQNATVRFCKASNLISVEVVLMCIQAVHTWLKSTSLKCFLVMVYLLLRTSHRCFVVWGFFSPLIPSVTSWVSTLWFELGLFNFLLHKLVVIQEKEGKKGL